MNTDKKVSVITGIYNCAQFLDEAIMSIVNQTYPNWEFIMCDDGSNDNTLEIARKYEAMYPDKIKVIRNEKNMMLASALNHCLKYATGDYIARMDGDDISVPTRFERQVDFLNNNPEYAVVGTAMIPFDEKGENGIKICRNNFDLNKIRFCFHATLMARKEMYDRLNGYRTDSYTTRCEDIDLWYRLSATEMKTYNLDEPLYRVREDINAFKRRSLKQAVNVSRTKLYGMKLMKFPFYKYVLALQPIISALIPSTIMKKRHNIKDKKNKNKQVSN